MSEKMFTLPVDRQLAPSVSLRTLDRMPVVVVDHAEVRAAVSLQGAQLLLWQPNGEQPVVWLSDRATWTPGTAIRGGVPICWPWFGSAGRPAHGFARTALWQLGSHEETPDGVELTLTLQDTEATREVWPHAFTLIARITVGRECSVEVEARGDHASTAALHTYVHVGALEDVRISGLGRDFVNKLLDDAPGRGDGTLRPTEHIDRIYTQPNGTSVLDDRRLERVVEVRHHEHSDVVVWNPGPELSRGMADLADEAYQEFVCVETARITRPLVSTPDAPARLVTHLRIGT